MGSSITLDQLSFDAMEGRSSTVWTDRTDPLIENQFLFGYFWTSFTFGQFNSRKLIVRIGQPVLNPKSLALVWRKTLSLGQYVSSPFSSYRTCAISLELFISIWHKFIGGYCRKKYMLFIWSLQEVSYFNTAVALHPLLTVRNELQIIIELSQRC